MTRIGTYLAGFVCLLAMGAMPSMSSEAHDRTTEIFGEPFGLALVMELNKACDHAREVLDSAAPEDRTLLMTDREATRFYSEPCDGVCDFAQVNSIVSRCRSEEGIEDCVVYGAAFGGELYDVSVDPHGNKIVDCVD